MRDFFERQDEARRNTVRLAALFIAAVVAMIIGIYGAAVAFLSWGGGQIDLVQPGLALVVAVGTVAVVGVGSGVKTLSLRQGGHVVAESLGGNKLTGEPDSLAERRLLNVVEEMAIAAGVPVPSVYVLEEEGINAFAAGFTTDDAVIGVTRGCIELLDRDELQGVIAHEFSHVLNEDMRINLRLMGLLHGILLISLAGRLVLHTAFYTGGGRNRDNKGKIAFLLFGVALVVIGFAGYFFGTLIKAAVSRQREFLADAAAVQFTRNPDGLAGALKKIGGHVNGAEVEASGAEASSHLFFGNALESQFLGSGWLSTHPPLTERIQRIDPAFDGSFPSVSASDGASASPGEGAKGVHGGGAPASRTTSSDAASDPAEQAGTLNSEHIAYAERLHRQLPAPLRHAAHDPLGAVALLYGLVLSPREEVREQQWDLLRQQEPAPVVSETEHLWPVVREVERSDRLPLAGLAAPALRDLSDEQRARFRDTLRALAESDETETVFEYALQALVRHRLDHAAAPSQRRGAHRRLRDVVEEVEALLSVLAHVGHQTEAAARRAVAAAVRGLDGYDPARSVSIEKVAPETLDAALDQLAETTPSLKRDILQACTRCVQADNTVTAGEADLLRAVAMALNVPVPPVLSEEESSVPSAPDS
ncbi:MAG: M48 family metallopeptidase [Salinibacter sp.]